MGFTPTSRTSLKNGTDGWINGSILAGTNVPEGEGTGTYGHISDWNTSNVDDMNYLFNNKTTFNEDISKWDTSSVTKMHVMFGSCSNFNQDISTKQITAQNSITGQAYTAWDTSNVTNMANMFKSATVFNNGQTNNGASVPLNWNTSSVTNMYGMFESASAFNQLIDWVTSNVTSMGNMFKRATVFNQNIQTWDISSVLTMSNMFFMASAMHAIYGVYGTAPNQYFSNTPNALFFPGPPPPPPDPICFPKGTPVLTNLGPIAIEKLNPDKHTIRGNEIVAITQSRPLQKHIVCFEKDSLSKNVPSQQSLCSMEHKIFFKGEMVKARDLVDLCENVTFVPYNGETLYNVLLKKHDKMMINNLICETLHPENIAAKISQMKDGQKKNKAIQELTKIIKENNVPEYQKLYASL
tara:strand:+ start:1630 stop:2859 length:1230 start_codon:yes stop_codon:yes gene_type:complete